MFYVYNTETKSIVKVDKINKAIHRHRNTKEVFTFDEEIVQSVQETPVKSPVKQMGRPKSK